MRALVREPATTDGRIRAGDKIIAVNDIPISNMTHEQAVIFLRQAPDSVKLRLYRYDDATSPTDSNYKSNHVNNSSNSSGTMKRSKLRPEAISLISDLATKKSTQSSSENSENSSSFQSSSNTMSSPRRLRKTTNNNGKCGQHGSASSTAYDTDNLYDSSSTNNVNQTYVFNPADNGAGSGTHTPFSDSSADTLTVVSQRIKYYDPHELPADDDDTNDGFYDSDELESLEHDNDCSSSDNNRYKRPESLTIKAMKGTGDSGSTPLASRKPLYKFTIATTNAYELNNLDAVLDAPTTTYRMDSNASDLLSNDIIDGHDLSFTSLPCETLLLACKTENDLRKSPLNDTDTCLYVTKFSKNQPLYQSAQVQINHHKPQPPLSTDDGEKNLLKWKGVTMPASSSSSQNEDNDDDKCSIVSSQPDEERTTLAANTMRISIRNAQKDIHLDEMGIDSNVYRVRFFFVHLLRMLC